MADKMRIAGQGVQLAEQDPVSVHMLRVRRPAPGVIAAIGTILGVPLPTQPNRTAGTAPRAIWMGPDEWMIIGAAIDADALAAASSGATTLVVPVGDGRYALDVSGERARDFLAKAVSIDLHPRAFPAGHSAMTLFAQVPVVIDQPDPDRFLLWFDISFQNYVRVWCRDALIEFTG